MAGLPQHRPHDRSKSVAEPRAGVFSFAHSSCVADAHAHVAQLSTWTSFVRSPFSVYAKSVALFLHTGAVSSTWAHAALTLCFTMPDDDAPSTRAADAKRTTHSTKRPMTHGAPETNLARLRAHDCAVDDLRKLHCLQLRVLEEFNVSA